MPRTPKVPITTLPGSIATSPDAVAHFLASVVENSDDAILTKDLAGNITSWNTGAEHLFGYSAGEAVGKPITMLIPAERLQEEPAILERIKQGERVDHYETTRLRKDGSPVEISLTVSPIRASDGKIIGASKIARDITERKRAQARQEFLIRELEHRTRNMFAMIQSIANRTLVESRSFPEARQVLSGRLQVLASAHSLLADAAWTGAPLTDIIKMSLGPFASRVDLTGCELVLNTPATQQFSLAAHELATNAVKYGALSAPNGRISITGHTKRENDHGTFTFLWKETGGPIVIPPKRRGFGSVILLEAAKQFGEHVKLDYQPDGLAYELRYLLRAIEPPHDTHGVGQYGNHKPL